MRFAYARTGGPLLNWSGHTPPYPSRAGETRALGAFYATNRDSSALRRYGGRLAVGGPIGARPIVNRSAPRYNGSAVGYQHNRALGDLDIPRPGAPEIVSGYESPQPNAALINLGGYIPEGAARSYGGTFLSADETPPTKQFDMGLVRKASVLAALYHGVKRNNGSVWWGLAWALGAYMAPLYGTTAVGIAVAQGFAQAKPKQNPARRRRRKGRRRARVGNKAWRRRFPRQARRLDSRRRRRRAKPYRAKGFV